MTAAWRLARALMAAADELDELGHTMSAMRAINTAEEFAQLKRK
jgi:hypothetical protein